MRITKFSIDNYRGIRHASLSGLESSPLLLLTGRNGTGKSLILEALTAAWNANINLPDLVGPYGNSLAIEVSVQLSAAEYETINRWRIDRGLDSVIQQGHHTLVATSTKHEMTGFYSQQDDALLTLQNSLFAATYPFASIDLLSARRRSSTNTTTAVDLSILDRTSNAEQRRLLYEQEIRWKSGMEMPDIGSYLASLDYRNYVSHRDGLPVTDEYERIQSIFFQASDKAIELPTYDPETTKSSINVKLPSGAKHPISDLSNGEQELLGMLYYVSQLNAQGGVLLLDEPEKHLHPTLQLAALRAMAAIADRGQLLVVTHSPGIISSSPADQVIVVQPAWNPAPNQLQRASELENQADLLADIGLTSRDLLQTNYLLVVEGTDDEKRLRMLLPNELAGAKVITAGGVDNVLKMATSLRGLEIGVPWLCVIDRDFMSAEEVKKVTSIGDVFVWDARMLENVLLSTDVLPELLTLKGTSIDDAKASVKAAIEHGRETSYAQFVNTRVERAAPPETSKDTKSGTDRALANLLHQRELWNYRIENYEKIRDAVGKEFDDNWDKSWADFVDGKKVFADIQKSSQIFRNVATLIDSLMVRMRDEPGRLPESIGRLKAHLSRLSKPQAAAEPLIPVPSVPQPPTTPVDPDPLLNAVAPPPYYQGGC